MTKLSRSKFLNSAALLLAFAAFGMTGCDAHALSGNASEEQTQDAASTADRTEVSAAHGSLQGSRRMNGITDTGQDHTDLPDIPHSLILSQLCTNSLLSFIICIL